MTDQRDDDAETAKAAPEFADRLSRAQARQRAKEANPRSADGKAMGIGMRLSLELVVATTIGARFGYAFDWVLGTGPWLLIVGVPFGAAAGIRNMLRAMEEIDGANTPGNDEEDGTA